MSAAVPEAIVQGARRALELHGATGITLERIAAEAGVSRMTLHRRGVSKDDVLRELARRLEARVPRRDVAGARVRRQRARSAAARARA
jgi:AcrR family transcriptional regulator